VHLLHDVAAADELLFDVDLGDGGPLRVLFDLVADGVISEDVHILELLHTVSLQHHHHETTEAALRHLAGAFHEHYHIVVVDPLVKLLSQLLSSHRSLGLRLKVVVGGITAKLAHLSAVY